MLFKKSVYKLVILWVSISLFIASCSDKPSSINYKVHTFYYAWYGSPELDGGYHHWNHSVIPHWADKRWDSAGSFPGGDDIGANFYPQLGCYSSHDTDIIEKHMEMIRDAGVGVVAISWWGDKGSEEKSMMKYFDIAHEYDLKIAFHFEPCYRTIEEFRRLLGYVSVKYGDHPALYLHEGKPLHYIYDSNKIPWEDWKKITDPEGEMTIRNTPLDANLVGIYTLRTSGELIIKSGFDGFYTYFASDGFIYGSTPENWPAMAEFAHENELIFIPCAGPGYIDTRIRPWNDRNTEARLNGEYYEKMFNSAAVLNPDFIGITSFNEWHEGTQIEPAIPKSIPGYKYEDYGEGTDPMYYIYKTKELTDQFK